MSRSVAKKYEPKLCPTCWNDMRPTKEGYVCPRHGLVETRVEPRTMRTTPTKRAKCPRAIRAPRPPRQPNQTDRLIEKRDEIIARNHAGESIKAISIALWQDLGYASPDVCASKISHFLGRRGLRAAEHRPGPSPGTVAEQRFTVERLAELRAALDDGASVWSFAGSHWQNWGFRSRSSCDSLLRKWLRTRASSPHG